VLRRRRRRTDTDINLDLTIGHPTDDERTVVASLNSDIAQNADHHLRR
jgi:hypothetical protein